LIRGEPAWCVQYMPYGYPAWTHTLGVNPLHTW